MIPHYKDGSVNREVEKEPNCAVFCSKNRYQLCMFGIVSAVLFPFSIIFCIPLLIWPTVSNYCTFADSLGPHEQMWCEPEKLVDITSVSPSNQVRFYRVSKSDLPNVMVVNKKMYEPISAGSYESIHISFVMMTGSRMKAYIESSKATDIICLMDHKNYLIYKNSDGDDDKSPQYIMKEKGILQTTFNVVQPGAYHFVVYHGKRGNSMVVFDMDINYAMYDLSSVKPANCSKKECEYSGVHPDEMIIAENPEGESCNAQIFLPRTATIGVVICFSALILVCEVTLLIIGIVIATMFIRGYATYYRKNKNERIDHQEKETTPLVQETTPLARDSSETSTPGSAETHPKGLPVYLP